MVFKTDKQRKGFFANLKGLQERHKFNVEMKLQNTIKKEEKELAKIQSVLKQRQQHQTLVNARQEQMQQQRNQIKMLKEQEKEARKQAFALTRTGRAVKLIRDDTRKVATSEKTRKVLKRIGKELGV